MPKKSLMLYSLNIFCIAVMDCSIVAYDANFNRPANSQRVYPSMRNVHVLCPNCPSPATTQAQSLFCHSPTT